MANKFYSYEVTGRGPFPFDMLRYDAAWPATSEDAGKIDPDPAAPRGHRTVKLNSAKAPTNARWSSFLWSVGEVRMAR